MIKAVVGSGGKTTLIHQLAKQYRKAGKKVFVTTTTKMLIEEDTLLSTDANEIIMKLNHEGYVLAGTPVGKKIIPLSSETYEAVCQHADVVLIEADGSRCLPLKYPNFPLLTTTPLKDTTLPSNSLFKDTRLKES
jgi:xanthine dehydrogenase accessory factor